jgi:hypothetical protein
MPVPELHFGDIGRPADTFFFAMIRNCLAGTPI